MIAFHETLSTAPEPEFRQVCSWCNEVQDGLGPVRPLQPITHTCCAGCASTLFPELTPDEVQRVTNAAQKEAA